MPIYLTYDQISERLHVPRNTVEYWVAVGKLPAFKPGRHPLVKEADLAAFVEAGSLTAAREAKAKAARKPRKPVGK